VLLTGQSNEGRDTLPNLAGEVAEMDYQTLPVETKQAYVNTLEEFRKEKKGMRVISKKEIGKNFGKTMAKLQPEVRVPVRIHADVTDPQLNAGYRTKSAHRLRVSHHVCTRKRI